MPITIVLLLQKLIMLNFKKNSLNQKNIVKSLSSICGGNNSMPFNSTYVIFFAVIFFYSCSSTKYSFSDFVQGYELRDSVSKYYYESYDLEKALPFLVKLSKIDNSFNYELAEVYYQKSMFKKSLKYLKRAIDYNINFSDIDSSNFPVIYNNIKDYRDRNIPKFSVDSNLVCELINMFYFDQLSRNNNILKKTPPFLKGYNCTIHNYGNLEREAVDSINLLKLKLMWKQGNWPTYKNINNEYIQDIPSTIIIHQDKKTNYYFLNNLIPYAENRLISWFSLITISQNLIKRFPDNAGKCELPYININQKIESIKNDKKQLILYSLFYILKNNKQYTIILYNTKSNYNEEWIKYLKNYLYKRGIDKKRIMMKTTKNFNDLLLVKFKK